MIPQLPVSVIVCTRNRAEYLSDCLHSLARQNCTVSYEILVVDNDSTDDTPRVLREWSVKDPRLRTVREPRVGLSAAKNTGVRLARGQLLLFTDDDVIVDPGWVQAYVDFFERRAGRASAAGGPILPVPDDLGGWPEWFDSCAVPDVGVLEYREERQLGPHEYLWGANMAIPASHFTRFGAWDETVGRSGEKRGTFEDTEYQDRMRAAGGTVWFCPAARLQHRCARREILPSRLLSTAYSRGRNQFWQEVVARREHGTFAPSRDYVSGAALLTARLVTFVLSSLWFAFRPTRATFARAHAAAWASGASMDHLRAGRESTRLSAAIGRLSVFALDSVLRVLRLAEKSRG